MRIENIILQNYRQFKYSEIAFNRFTENDLHIFIGKNGTGKTNLLNGVNWCLYGDEPHLSQQSKQLPILNLNTISEAENDEDKEVIVEVQLKTNDNRYIIFRRKVIYRIYNSEKLVQQDIDFEAKVADEKGNIEILKEDEANTYVERFVPRTIRDYFFFDGERLDNYFRKATSQKIRHAIFVISQLELLENKLERRLDEILREFRKEAGNLNPNIEETRRMLEEMRNRLEIKKKEIEECYREISIANSGLKECDEKLAGIPNLERLEKERGEQRSKKKNIKELLFDKKKEKQDFLFENGILIMLHPAIKKSLRIIEEKKKGGEIPPTIDKRLLSEIINNKVCSICGRLLDKESEKRVSNLFDQVKLSSDIAQELSNMENPLHYFEDKINVFKDKMKVTSKEIIKCLLT